MRAAIVEGVKKIVVQEKEKPVSDGERVIIKVAYTGICGSDLHYTEHGDDWANGLQLGHEFTGYVDDPGSRDDLKVGDRVVIMPSKADTTCEVCKAGNTTLCEAPLTEALGLGVPGAYGDYVSVKPHVVFKLKDTTPMQEATLVEPSAVGLFASKHLDPEKDRKVLVIGAGIIGLMTAMWVKKRGAELVVMCETGDNRLEFARTCDFIDVVIDGKAEDCKDQILAANGGNMYDAMMECVGIEATLNAYLRMIKSGGKFVLIGVPQEPMKFDFNTLVVRNMDIITSHAWNFKEFGEALEAVENGETDLKKYITKIVPLDDIQAAVDDLTSGNTKNVKVLLNVNAEE